MHNHITNNYYYYYCTTVLWPFDQDTRVNHYQKKQSPTHTYPDHQPSFISFIYYKPQHLPCSIYLLDMLFAQPFSKSSLVYVLVWNPPLHTPYISSPNHCLLFATNAHTIATCFAVVPRLSSNPSLSLNSLLGTLSFTLMSPFSSLPAEVTPHFHSLRARTHFHATYYFAHKSSSHYQ